MLLSIADLEDFLDILSVYNYMCVSSNILNIYMPNLCGYMYIHVFFVFLNKFTNVKVYI